MLQQKLLEAASGWFTAALKSKTFIEGNQGTLDFPDDDRKVWEFLIYWMLKHKLPFTYQKNENLLILVKCWVLGDKYGIEEFQDEAMFRIIRRFEKDFVCEEAESELYEILNLCTPRSKLACIIAENVAEYAFDGPIRLRDLTLGSLGNIWPEFLVACSTMQDIDDVHNGWTPRLNEDADFEHHWTLYMFSKDLPF